VWCTSSFSWPQSTIRAAAQRLRAVTTTKYGTVPLGQPLHQNATSADKRLVGFILTVEKALSVGQCDLMLKPGHFSAF